MIYIVVLAYTENTAYMHTHMFTSIPCCGSDCSPPPDLPTEPPTPQYAITYTHYTYDKYQKKSIYSYTNSSIYNTYGILSLPHSSRL